MTVTGRQLVYTNVEADRSPARQRGFQVWLKSSDLTAEQVRAAAKRVDDFRLPPGVRPDDPAAVRHTVARLDGGLVLIAQTKPMTDRDKFGRGGKFYAHAVLLTPDAFAQLDHDPFRLIDGGFPFQSHPDEVGDGWRSGELPDAVVTPGPPSEDVQALPPDRLRAVFDHLARGDDRPLVLPAPPGRVLAVLRGWFRAFPPAVRAGLTFDTLSHGCSLAAVPYAVVGGYSADLLKLWSFRRYVRLDPTTGDAVPKLEASTGLPGSLLTAPGWGELTDPEKDAVYVAARAAAAGDLAEVPPDLPAAGVELLAGSAGFARAVAAAAETWAGRHLPAALVAVPEVGRALAVYLDGPPAAVLDRLRHPPPRDRVAAALAVALDRDRSPPAPELLADLGRWLAAGPPDRRVEAIFRRWRGRPQDFAYIDRLLVDGDLGFAGSFRDWLAGTLGGATADDLLDRLPLERPADPDALRNARVWLALNREAAGWVELRLTAAFHAGPDELAAAGVPSAQADGWLVKHAVRLVRPVVQPGWLCDADGWLVGLFATPDRSAARLLDAVGGGGLGVQRRLAERLVTAVTGEGPAKRSDKNLDVLPPRVEPFYNAVFAVAPGGGPPAVKALRHQLGGGSQDEYRAVANKVVARSDAVWCVRHVGGDLYFAGCQVRCRSAGQAAEWLGVLEAVVSSAVPEVRLADGGEVRPAKPLDPGFRLLPPAARRLGWLLARLGDPAGTADLDL